MSYYIIYRNDFTGHYSLCSGPHSSIKEAADHRKVSGDLVVNVDHLPVPDESWLWDWEKNGSYAQRMINFIRMGRNFHKGMMTDTRKV